MNNNNNVNDIVECNLLHDILTTLKRFYKLNTFYYNGFIYHIF